MLVSIIIPSYNEIGTLSQIVDLVNEQDDIEKEIIKKNELKKEENSKND